MPTDNPTRPNLSQITSSPTFPPTSATGAQCSGFMGKLDRVDGNVGRGFRTDQDYPPDPYVPILNGKATGTPHTTLLFNHAVQPGGPLTGAVVTTDETCGQIATINRYAVSACCALAPVEYHECKHQTFGMLRIIAVLGRGLLGQKEGSPELSRKTS